MAAPTPSLSLPSRLLQDHLRQDVLPRESSIFRFMGGLTAFCGVAVLLVGGIIGWALSLCIASLMALLCLYYVCTLWLVRRRGGLPPVIQWVDTAVMVSIPAVVFALDTLFNGAEYALTTPPLVVWAAPIVVCSLRAGKRLAYVAATLAALEYLALYFVLALPRLPADTLSTLTPPLIAFRAVFLFAYGPLTATLAGHLVRKAEETLRLIRERDVMGKYLLHERLGVGGMAEVFRATYSPEGGFEKQVAVKRILPAYTENEKFLAMFRREAELGSRLIHPNIIQVLDLGRHQGTLFLAMEFVDGMPLSTLLQRLPGKRLPPAAVAYIGAELAGALTYLHGRTDAKGEPLGLVHRDVNPPNVLLSCIGEVKLSDFGIVRARHEVPITQGNDVKGKAGYMAPEQTYGQTIDGRADLFALGLTLHEALTGRPTLYGENEVALMLAASEQQVAPPSKLQPGISSVLDAIIMGLLHPEAAQRTPSAEVLQRQLLVLAGDEAPYPQGRQLLVEAVRQARNAPPSGPDISAAPTVSFERPQRRSWAG
ncbi:serine/threonine-protein kinase [Hyalangium rubrum]|uniref:Serine/threonine-protein kinase n=1 Tax=Hyalangium rubrum TaxID=3103134 RepID=A0ABU5H6N3_9BACT|nr:serine/threonine-protein kinase [Hyalangium sp. s54d21]MDY7228916.1 serine/threonine-protein kinase [Hyalangium sp. s54d21]